VEVTKPGQYEMPCAELCGFGHSGMKGYLFVHTPEDFQKWVKEKWPA
jgi:cytochrome c oxidase subunit 2